MPLAIDYAKDNLATGLKNLPVIFLWEVAAFI